MRVISRHVHKVLEYGALPAEEWIRPLLELRDLSAWVLLGEPGAGKTTALQEEAKATGGLFISIAEFLVDEPDNEWRGKTLFLDGLDETRAGGGDSILLKIRSRLKKLGTPPFRLACRAADWFGSTDRAILQDVSPDGQLTVLQLDPLHDAEIFDILRQNHAITDPKAFVKQATQQGVDGLLGNPQTLGLLAQAIRDGQWPKTRQQTFERACIELAREQNEHYRNQQRCQPHPDDKLLDAAGQLCAAILLSDKTGIALDPKTASERFPTLMDFSPPDPEMSIQVVRRPLFCPSPSGEERVVPSHRSIAEFLAARWLAQQIDRHGLPLGRVLNLLFGTDRRTVAGLRGLYGWLALHCQAARSALIEADPVTVVVYGNVTPMPPADKRHILAKLRHEAERHTAFFWDIRTTTLFGALAAPELMNDFVAALTAPERDDASQAFAHCVLEILAEGEALPLLASTVKNLILDDARKGGIRTGALRAWLNLGASPQEALSLLDAIADHTMTDNDDELAGHLLRHLYPQHIKPETVLRYLHSPKIKNLAGGYTLFWGYLFPQIAPLHHLPILLDHLAERTDIFVSDECDFHFHRMASDLLCKGIELCGDHVTNERLYCWLGIGTNKYGQSRREPEHRTIIANWLKQHPERYTGLLTLCFHQCAASKNPEYCLSAQKQRLQGAESPPDIGRWHLEQASQITDATLTELHLTEAVNTLVYQCGNAGLSLETIEAWADTHPNQKHLLNALLVQDIPSWRLKETARNRIHKQKYLTNKHERSLRLSQDIAAIRAGTANAALMDQLAGVWLNHFSDTPGNTLLERFDSYCENSPEVLSAAESGFRHCLLRNDLPTVAEIIDSKIKQQEHFIRKPCLTGMALLWQDGAKAISALSDDILNRMVAFQLTYGAVEGTDWFTYLVETRPDRVAEVLIDYARRSLQSGRDFVNGIYPLAHDTHYRPVASIAVPIILEHFPLRCKSGQLRQLEYLLKAALQYSLDRLPALLKKKIATKSIDVAQKVYWLTAAMLFDPEKHEMRLWGFVGNSRARTNYLVGFLSEDLSDTGKKFPLSARTIGQLIEHLTPHAELEWPPGGGLVNDAMKRGNQVRSLITRLGLLETTDAAQEIERLITLPSLAKLTFLLEISRHQLRLKQRENAFRFPPLAGVAKILANREPADAADLYALTIDHLDDIAQEIRRENDDGFRTFWNVENKKPTSQREENLCRDVLLTRLRNRLAAFDIDCQPEGDYANDKRADIRLSFRNEFELPIEIKRDSNASLWTALRSQLIDQYTIAPKTAGHGIYLVLWFGKDDLPAAKDGGKKPRSPEELQTRLEAQLDASERQRIAVRVLDVSWPNSRETENAIEASPSTKINTTQLSDTAPVSP